MSATKHDPPCLRCGVEPQGVGGLCPTCFVAEQDDYEEFERRGLPVPVPDSVRDRSKWDPDYAAYRAPDGRYWSFRSPRPGVELLDADGQHVTVPVYCIE